MITLQHALAVFLFLILPIWDFFTTRQLRKSDGLKLAYYKKLIIILWVAAVASFFVMGPQIIGFELQQNQLVWLHTLTAKIAGIVVALLVIYVMLAPFPALRKPVVRQKVQEAFAPLGFFMPGSTAEFRWFTLVCITAGVCEEALYRGFLLRYLSLGPWHLGIWGGLVLSSLSFGSAHAYQGAKGVLAAALTGFVFGMLFLWTGTLLIPVVVHAFIDLRAMLLLRMSIPSTNLEP